METVSGQPGSEEGIGEVTKTVGDTVSGGGDGDITDTDGAAGKGCIEFEEGGGGRDGGSGGKSLGCVIGDRASETGQIGRVRGVTELGKGGKAGLGNRTEKGLRAGEDIVCEGQGYTSKEN